MAVLSALDRLEIVELQSVYAWGIDNRDGRQFGRAFTVDVEADYPGLATLHGLAEFTTWMDTFHSVFDATQHLVSNPCVEVDGDEVLFRSYIQAKLVRRGHRDGETCTGGGYYLDRVVRTDAGWRIRSRQVVGIWQEGNPGIIAHGIEAVRGLAR